MNEKPSPSQLDTVLAGQLAVAWAGEAGEAPRMRWWRTDLANEFGGEDLFARLLPHTWRWAVLEGALEAAKRRVEEIRSQAADTYRLITLFRLGFEIDEHLEGRLADLKRTESDPRVALPVLAKLIGEAWSKEAFVQWLNQHGEAGVVTAPVGRRIKGDPPERLEQQAHALIAALNPLPDSYPMPHYRRPA